GLCTASRVSVLDGTLPSSTCPRPLHTFPTRLSSDLPWGQILHRTALPYPKRMFGCVHYSTGPPQVQTSVRKIPPGRVDRNDCSVDRKSTRLNSSHVKISYAVFCLKKKKLYIIISCHI